MIGHEEALSTAENFRRFARIEASGRSPLYSALAEGVASDPEMLTHLATLPAEKRQPNLLLGAVRFLYGTAGDYGEFRSTALEHWDELAATIGLRRTQTNEVGRCATLLPLLAELPEPLALFEIGASAGLCLLLDRYRYDYGRGPFGPTASPVTLRCRFRGPKAPPRVLPEIAWRAGIDLHPVDVDDREETRWLECLVWPDEGDRASRLVAALDLARADPPQVEKRDLRDGFADLLADVPRHATLVIFHSAVLAYVPAPERRPFIESMMSSEATWLANEAPRVVPGVAALVDEREIDRRPASFLIARNARPVAWADDHGAWFQWREQPAD